MMFCTWFLGIIYIDIQIFMGPHQKKAHYQKNSTPSRKHEFMKIISPLIQKRSYKMSIWNSSCISSMTLPREILNKHTTWLSVHYLFSKHTFYFKKKGFFLVNTQFFQYYTSQNLPYFLILPSQTLILLERVSM